MAFVVKQTQVNQRLYSIVVTIVRMHQLFSTPVCQLRIQSKEWLRYFPKSLSDSGLCYETNLRLHEIVNVFDGISQQLLTLYEIA